MQIDACVAANVEKRITCYSNKIKYSISHLYIAVTEGIQFLDRNRDVDLAKDFPHRGNALQVRVSLQNYKKNKFDIFSFFQVKKNYKLLRNHTRLTYD